MTRKWLISALLTSSALAFTTPALAQEAVTEPETKETESLGVGEILVTAQKRSESINSVGMAISAVSGDDLADQGVTDVKDLTRVIPGFTFAQSQKGAPVYSLRGVGFFEESLGATPAVSIYVDEVGYPFPIVAKAASLDLERVEVLKGPQGTLFGQNSTGGAVNYIAAKPSQDFSAGIQMSLNNFGGLVVGGHVGGGLSETLAVRLAAEVSEGGAWQRSASRGEENGAADLMKARLLLDWQPTEAIKVSLNLNGFRDRSDSLAGSLVAVTPQSPARATAEQRAQVPVPMGDNRLADWNPEYDLTIDEDFLQGALRFDIELSDAVKLTSISALATFDQKDFRDTDGSPLSIFAVAQNGSIDSFSQELRMSGELVDGSLNYVVGGYYANDRTRENNRSILPASTSASAFRGVTGRSFLGVDMDTSQKSVTKAVFGNIDFDVSDLISVHAGARHTWSDVDYNGCMIDIDGLYAAGISSVLARINPAAAPAQQFNCVTVLPTRTVGQPLFQSLSEENTAWRFGIDLKPVRGTLIYGTVSRGFKSGSFPNINATSFASLTPVTQESVTAYEVGLKTDLGTRIAHLDASVFYYDYKDKQFRGRIVDLLGVFGAVEALVNVPKSRVQGAEASLRVEPVEGLSLSGAVTYLDTKVTSAFSNYNPYGTLANFQGEAFPFTPKWTVQGGFNYTAAFNDRINGFLGANASYRTGTKSAFGENAVGSLYPYSFYLIDPYVLVDAQAGIKDKDEKWQLAFWVRNLGGKYYWTDTYRQIDNVSRHLGEARTYGVRFSYDF